MFVKTIWGEIDGRTIKIILGRRYRITTSKKTYEGTITKCDDYSFSIKTVDGGFLISFELVDDIDEL